MSTVFLAQGFLKVFVVPQDFHLKRKSLETMWFQGFSVELLTRFELVTSSLPTTVEPSSPCCIRLCGVFLSKKDEVAACLFHCFRPLISPCGSRCGSELLQDMNKGPAFGNGNPPILLIASKWLKLHGTYSVSSIPQAWQKMK